jgi:drug/metabolite transporter (DMT)-like permease
MAIKTGNKNRFRNPTLFGFLAILLWSMTVAFTRSISENLGPFSSGAFVYILAGLFLYLVKFLQKNKNKRSQNSSLLYLFGCGSLFTIYTTCLYSALNLAINHEQTLEVGLINYLWPALTLLFSLPILGKKAHWGLIPGTFIALAGVFLTMTQGTSFHLFSIASNLEKSALPYYLGFIAAITWALYSNLSRHWGGTDSDGAVPFFSLATGFLFMILAFLFPEKITWTSKVIIEIIVFSSATSLAYLFWDIAMRKGNIVLVAAGSYLIPLLSTIVSSIYFRIFPASILWMGCLFILSGSLMSWRSIDA